MESNTNRFSGLSPLKQALLAVEDMQRKLAEHERERHEPIAIIGMACRFPHAANPASYWRLLKSGEDAVGEVPASRWKIDDYYDPDPDAPGKMSTRWGGFVDGVEMFDPEFFGISPREAASMDPQQRLLLEVAWEALEDAGQGPKDLVKRRTGVFAGITSDEYAQEFHRARDLAAFNAYFASGIARSVASGRICYTLGIEGPNMAIDTACSSSLVAVHTACLYLRMNECRLALAGGSNVILAPEISIAYSKSHMMAADGRCKAFDSRADGFVRGEGCGIVALKRLSDAIADGDRVLALIRGSAINQDGRSSGLTVPNVSAQQAVIRQALASGGVKPEEVGYIEAHGTGTSLGDPIEASALASVFGPGRTEDNPLIVGSAKTNLGHLESVAGAAGLIKAVLALREEEIPPSLHFRQMNPHVDWRGMPVRIPVEPRPWPRGTKRRIAGVSSFGFSGTNAHVLVEEAPAVPAPEAQVDRPLHVVTVSARSTAALGELAREYAERIAKDETALADTGFTANAGRAHFDHRVAAIGATNADVAAGLIQALPGERMRHRDGLRVAFLFPGQGAQYARMGKELYDTHPGFRRSIDECAELLKGDLEEPLHELLWGSRTDQLDQTRCTQPALFAVEYATAQLWRSWGIEPVAVLGHSVGEYVAACVAGVYSVANGLKLIATRARLMQNVRGSGAMSAVMAAEDRVREAVNGFESRVRIAAVNAPESTVISGFAAEVALVEERMRRAGFRVQRLTVSHAFHSPQMAEMEAEFEAAAQRVTYAAPQVELISSVTGRAAAFARLSDPAYWRKQVSEPVRFRAAMETLAAKAIHAFVEVGPGATLSGLGRQTILDRETIWAPTLRAGREWRQTLDSLARLWTNGADVDWAAFDAPYQRRRVALPTYPFERQRYWIEKPAARPAPAKAGGHPLLGERLELAGETAAYVWQSSISTAAIPYLADHRAFGSLIFPLTGYLEMMTAAAADARLGARSLKDVVVYEPLTLTADESRTLQLTLRGDELEIFSKSEAGWKRHATARLAAQTVDLSLEPAAAVVARLPREIGADEFYRAVGQRGMEFGPAFRAVRRLRAGTGESLAEVAPPEGGGNGYRIHPACLDGCFQALAAAMPEGCEDLYLPVGIEQFELVRAANTALQAHAALRPGQEARAEALVFDIHIQDEAGLVARARGLQMRRLDSSARIAAVKRRADQFFEIAWEPASGATAQARISGAWLIAADRVGLGAEAARRLTALGAECVELGANAPFAETLASRAWQGVLYLRALDADSLAPIDAQDAVCGGALELVHALAAQQQPNPPKLWFVTRGARAVSPEDRSIAVAQAPLWGMLLAIGEEHPEWRAACVDLDPASEDPAEALVAELQSGEVEQEVAYRGGQRFAARLRKRVAREGLEQPLSVELGARGVLDNLAARPAQRRSAPAGWVEIQVDAAALNFRDVLNALGMYPGDPGPLGSECAGHIVSLGEGVDGWSVDDDVIAMLPGGQSGFAIADARLLARRPANLTAVQAATVTTAFLTARYTLETLARIRPGDRVLIHAATGGVGTAAIQIAQRAGAEIFATAGSERKRALLRSMGVPHVMNSRTLDFARDILRQTAGEGVDVVLNSLTGEFIAASFSVLANRGRFVEIGKRDIWTDEQVGALGRDISYFVVDLGVTSVEEPDVLGALLRDTVTAIERGELKPLPAHVYAFHEAPAAYRLMAQAQHIGKVVLRQSADGRRISPNGTYLVTGAFGALGLRVVRWLAEQGARNLALMGRRPPSAEGAEVVRELEQRGVRVAVHSVDVSRRVDLERAFAALAAMPPLRGALHLAGALDDGTLVQQTWERFERVLAPKAAGAWNLHKLTAGMPLDFFVMFSSAASVIAAPGQGNYAAANAFLDALAHERRRQGLPATSINWGAWAAGMAAREGLSQRQEQIGLAAMTAEEGLAALDQILLEGPAQTGAARFDWERFVNRYPADAIPKRFTTLLSTAAKLQPGHGAGLLDELNAAAAGVRAGILLERIHTMAGRVLGFGAGRRIDPTQPLNELGLDSLMAVEFRNALASATGLALPATILFSCPALDDLARDVGKRLWGAEPEPETPKPAGTALDAIEDLSDEEVERLFERKVGGPK
jgi:acyl transferase domain-containing protein